MRYTMNLLKFRLRYIINNTSMTDETLKSLFQRIKTDKLKVHSNSHFNNKPLIIKKNILYFNHFFEEQHFQIKLDLTNKRNSNLKIKQITNENKMSIILNKEISNSDEIISFIKKLN